MIRDISPLISPEIAVFPGDVAYVRRIGMDFSQGHHLNLSSIQSTLHLGAHADAPSHYGRDGQTIDQCALETYFGLCQVIDISPWTGVIDKKCLENIPLMAPRILFKTQSIRDWNVWQKDFAHLSAELVTWLGDHKICLIGIDTPSMDESESKSLEAHQAFYRSGLAILEGLALDQIDAGLYTLVAFPLKLKGAEASPVRAVLMDLEESTDSQMIRS